MTQKQLEDYLWGAANILRGMIDAADFKQYIFPLLFFKRISDLWDEEFELAKEESGGDLEYAEFAESHRFQIPKNCHWKDVRKKTVDVGAALQKALNGIEKANFEMLHDVFGDAQWTNKRRMSDEKMLDLIEHFSKMNLSVANVPHDIMGEGYEYLIKKFADDSGHTAAEFYTNRTVVKLMTQITDPKSNESIYDPTCGCGGILLSAALHLKEQGKEYRTLKLYGQELNLITSAIARINMFMHNVDEFLIVQGDTLDSPQILENDELKKFDVIMAPAGSPSIGQSCKRASTFPTQTKLNLKKISSPSENKKYATAQTDTTLKRNRINGLQGRATRTTGYNTVLPKWRQKCYYETFVLSSTAVILLNFSANNPPLRQYPNR